jgi:hypothetical protein
MTLPTGSKLVLGDHVDIAYESGDYFNLYIRYVDASGTLIPFAYGVFTIIAGSFSRMCSDGITRTFNIKVTLSTGNQIPLIDCEWRLVITDTLGRNITLLSGAWELGTLPSVAVG